MNTKKQKKKVDKKNFLKSIYLESWNYIKDSRKFIYSSIILFFVFALLGVIMPVPDAISQQIINYIQEILEKTSGMSQFELISFIFFNNLQAGFYGILFGIVLGIFPVIASVVNGYILGFVAAISIKSEGFFVLWQLLPHGIFELPAIFISFGLGIKLGKFIFSKKKKETFLIYLKNSFKVFLFVIVPLLIIAAIIEGTLIFFGS